MIDSYPSSRVVNSQPEGIGRVVALDGMCAWNNLGRNVVFADLALRPGAVFDETAFPDDDEPSQFDLDIHAIVGLDGANLVAVLNHLGSLRLFCVPDVGGAAPARRVPIERHLDFVADIERVVALGDRIVTSRPRGQRSGGLLVSEPISGARGQLEARVELEEFGPVTALAAESTASGDGWLAIGGEGRVWLHAVAGGRLESPRWHVAVDFLPSVLARDGRLLWAAGSVLGGTGLDDYDWEKLRGGGLAALDLATGDVVVSARFGDDLAWGSGGVAFVVVGGEPCGIGRRGELHLLDGAVTVAATPPVATDSLGIAHATVVRDQLVVGFNRGGHRLYTWPASTITREAGARRRG